MKYRHLTLEQRSQIEELVSSNLSLRRIGEAVGVHASTISRELRRNGARSYNYVLAERHCEARRYEASCQFKKLNGVLEKKVLDGLYQLWSPEQISGRLKLEGFSISPEAIYRYVRKKGLRRSCLRHCGKKYRAKKASDAGVCCIPNRIDISERPKVIENKSRVGDWEGDTVISYGSHCAILTLVDRRFKYVIIRKIDQKTAEKSQCGAAHFRSDL